MKTCFRYFALLAAVCGFAAASPAAAAQTARFNDGWLFAKGEQTEAELSGFDDTAWRPVRLPHDWAIEGPFDKRHGARCGGLPYYGTGWYRKAFQVRDRQAGERVSVAFDGAMYDARVWVNGRLVGRRPNGYVGFEFDITGFLKPGDEENLIAVQLRPKEFSSRWYPGAGLYRNVWITRRHAVHVPQWGVAVTTRDDSAGGAVVAATTAINNTLDKPADAVVRQTVFAPNGSPVGSVERRERVGANSQTESKGELVLPTPRRWSTETPSLYVLVTEVVVDGAVVDTTRTRFGVRTIRFDPEEGFTLNGERVELKGVCLHHDLGPLGAAVNRRATRRQLEIMRAMGVNAIRTAHNPPSPEQLELCDEMGFLVIVEAFDSWAKGKTPNGYSRFFEEWHERDLEDIVRRDRNHPSVILWSVGNEILEQSDEDGWKIAKRLNDLCHRTDPSRPTTAGFDRYAEAFENRLVDQVDVVGLNYKPMFYGDARLRRPRGVFYGSETSSCTSSRGVYHLPIKEYKKHPSLQVTSYDFIAPNWAYPPDIEFDALDANPGLLGEFVWTGFDYLGEPTPYGGFDKRTKGKWTGDWPARSSYFGCVDLCGFPKDRFYLYQSRWTDEPVVHLLPHWDWDVARGTPIPVRCYTNCDEVELFLNGRSLGRKAMGDGTIPLPVGGKHLEKGVFESPYRLGWEVPYEPGDLYAVGYKGGKAVGGDRVATPGPPAVIGLDADRRRVAADPDELVFVTVRILDAAGNPCPRADTPVTFSCSEGGRLVAVGNGDATSTESFQASSRRAFSGQCLAIVAPAFEGAQDFELTATAEGLAPCSIRVSTPGGGAAVKLTTDPDGLPIGG